jgi:hypothetical protein
MPASKIGTTAYQSSIGKGTSTGTIGTTGTVHGHKALKLHVRAYSDADWAGCNDTRRSTTGMLVMLNNNLIQWSSKRQPIVATSSAESEYIALSNTAKEIKWLHHWLNELDVLVPNQLHHTKPTTIHVDNTAAIALAGVDAPHSRTKHIDTRYHFVREMVSNGDVQIQWTPTANQLADLLTKRLPTEPFRSVVRQLLAPTTPLADHAWFKDHPKPLNETGTTIGTDGTVLLAL